MRTFRPYWQREALVEEEGGDIVLGPIEERVGNNNGIFHSPSQLRLPHPLCALLRFANIHRQGSTGPLKDLMTLCGDHWCSSEWRRSTVFCINWWWWWTTPFGWRLEAKEGKFRRIEKVLGRFRVLHVCVCLVPLFFSSPSPPSRSWTIVYFNLFFMV